MATKHSLKLVLYHTSGDKLYPCLIKDRDNGKVAFVVAPPGGSNTKIDALQVSESEMINYVKNHNYKVRCSTLPNTSVLTRGRSGLYGVKERSIASYKFSV